MRAATSATCGAGPSWTSESDVLNGLDDLPGLKDVADAFGLRARRSLGQNFLFDENVLDRIARCAGDLEGAAVVEIGPGPGGLTRALLRAGAGKVLALETDPRCCAALSGLADAAGGRLEVLETDALEADLAAIVPRGAVVVGNLPFNSATELLMRLLGQRRLVDRMVLMFQKEVAQRIAAGPGSRRFGRLSILVQWLCRVERCFDLAPATFVPAPKVEASLLRITPLAEPLWPAREETLRMLVTAAFGQRRKVLRNSLARVCGDPEDLLRAAGVPPGERAENVSVAAWCALAREHASRTGSA